jgi:hypothetical protein
LQVLLLLQLLPWLLLLLAAPAPAPGCCWSWSLVRLVSLVTGDS